MDQDRLRTAACKGLSLLHTAQSIDDSEPGGPHRGQTGTLRSNAGIYAQWRKSRYPFRNNGKMPGRMDLGECSGPKDLRVQANQGTAVLAALDLATIAPSPALILLAKGTPRLPQPCNEG